MAQEMVGPRKRLKAPVANRPVRRGANVGGHVSREFGVEGERLGAFGALCRPDLHAPLASGRDSVLSFGPVFGCSKQEKATYEETPGGRSAIVRVELFAGNV